MAAKECEDSLQFAEFKKQLSNYEDQVLRYNISRELLWISCFNKATGCDIPACPCCTQRQFEIQIMPQLLNHLDMDEQTTSVGLDLGVLFIYTCQNSCSIGNDYVKEFLWNQDVSDSN